MNPVLFTVIFQAMFWGGILIVALLVLIAAMFAIDGVGAAPKPPSVCSPDRQP